MTTVGKRVLHHLQAVYDDALEMMRTSEQSFIAARDQLDTEMIAQYKAELDALGITIGSTPVIRDGRSEIEIVAAIGSRDGQRWAMFAEARYNHIGGYWCQAGSGYTRRYETLLVVQ